MHNHPPVDSDKPVNPDFQDNDINQPVVNKFIVLCFVVTLVAFFAMLIVFKGFTRRFHAERGIAQVENRQIAGEEDSLLQAYPLVDLQEYYDLEQARLNGETNVGVAKAIPIQTAMKLQLQENAFAIRAGHEATAASHDSHDHGAGADHH